MPVVVTCRCGSAFQAEDYLAGQSVRCPACGVPLAIPAPTNSADPLGLGSSSFDSLSSYTAPSLPHPQAYGSRSNRGPFPTKYLVWSAAIAGGMICASIVFVIGLPIFIRSMSPLPASPESQRQGQTFEMVEGSARPASGTTSSRRWTRHTMSEFGFSVEFPSAPREDPRMFTNPNGVRAKANEYKCALGDGSRDLGIVTLTVIDTGLTPQEAAEVGETGNESTLDRAINSFIRSQNNFQIRSQKSVMLGKTRGRELLFDGQVRGNSATKRVRYFYVGSMGYRLMWTGPPQQESAPEVEYFFQSFQLSSPPMMSTRF